MDPSVITGRINLYEKLMRLDKPIGILLLLWPTLWALWLAVRGMPDWTVLAIFLLGTVLMRSAGCVINDYADRDFDPHVARTKERPLAAKRISTTEALILAAVLALIAFALVLQLNRLTILLSFGALFVAVSYPFTKRFLALPQAYLGIAFSFGIPMAYAAQLSAVPLSAWVLVSANIFWTIAYDTEYAMVDRADDQRIGIRTAAILFGRFDVTAVMLCHAVFLSILAALGWYLQLLWPYYVGLMTAAVLIAQQYRMIRDREPDRCFGAFLDNNWVGAVIFAGIVFALLLERGGLK
jgi:4-hydroxybenzoate polyprenyltransferase